MITEAEAPAVDPLEAVLAEQAKIEANAVTEFHAIAKKLAAGEKIAPTKITKTMEAAKKTVEDLKEAIALHKQRHEWKQQIADAKQADQEIADANAKRNALIQEFEPVRQKYEKNLAELTAEIDQLRGMRNVASHAERQLRRTGEQADPSITEARERQLEVFRELQPRLANAQEWVGNCRRNIQSLEQALPDIGHEKDRKKAEAEIEEWKHRLELAHSKLDACREEEQEHRQAMDAISARVMET